MRALELLASGELSVTDVAFAVGFQDLRTFERAVERHTGLSPLALKRRLQRPVDTAPRLAERYQSLPSQSAHAKL